MLKELALALVVSVILSSPSFAMAKEGCGGECASCHKLSQQEASEILKKLGATVKSVKHSPSRGLFELLMEKEGQQGILFMDYGKKHIIQGGVFSLESLQPVAAHMKEMPQPKQVSSVDPKTIPVNSAFVMGNPKGSKKLYVFTDPDCPYCRKMHEELKKLEKLDSDVAINVMLFPLAMHPAANEKARVVLSRMSRELLDKAFAGQELPKAQGSEGRDKVEAIIAFANGHGISGTPTLVMPDGKIEVGMRSAEMLKQMLEKL